MNESNDESCSGRGPNVNASIKAIRGMNDILPTQTRYWSHLEETIRQIVDSYSYAEIRFPILEQLGR
jgi:histidyl-tRNA synthetase